ncbi:MAG: hypothetical protein M9894_16170 [Planctomycetes bacterium]|nr:hypothetical protein [Planctomycetota bacterium]
MSRLIAITYAGLTVGAGGASAYHLTGRYRFLHDYERASVTFEVVVQDDDPASFVAAEQALRDAYRTPDQALTVVLGATSRHDFDPALNTGFNARATARKLAGQEDTARSARYECAVAVELPASLSGRAGRRSSSVDVATSPSGRRTVTVEGVYTALANAAARAQFAASINAYAAGVLSGLGGTWELVGTPTERADDQNKVLRFTRRYAELLYDQAQGTRDHPAIVEPQVTFARGRNSASSSAALGPAQALVQLDASYSASVRFDQTTDLEDLWSNVVRPYVLAEARRLAGSTVVVTADRFSFDPDENVLSGNLSLLADPGAAFFQARVSLSESIDEGIVLKPVWDGNPWSRDRYDVPKSGVRVLTRTTLRRAPGAAGYEVSGDRVVSDHPAPPQWRGWIEVRDARRASSWLEGLPGEDLPLRASSTSYTYVRADVRSTGARVPTSTPPAPPSSDMTTRERPRT